MVVSAICVFFLLLGLCGMSGTVVWVIRKGNNNRVTRLFAFCQVAIILWLISHTFFRDRIPVLDKLHHRQPRYKPVRSAVAGIYC